VFKHSNYPSFVRTIGKFLTPPSEANGAALADGIKGELQAWMQVAKGYKPLRSELAS
jgi:hypothetical protein